MALATVCGYGSTFKIYNKTGFELSYEDINHKAQVQSLAN